MPPGIRSIRSAAIRQRCSPTIRTAFTKQSFTRHSQISTHLPRASFMTMSSLKSSAPATSSGSRQFDPEIKDMANYIHHYKIDSDLAVCLSLNPRYISTTADYISLFYSLKPLDMSSLIRLGVVWKPSVSKSAQNCLDQLSLARSSPTALEFPVHPTFSIPSTGPSISVL